MSWNPIVVGVDASAEAAGAAAFAARAAERAGTSCQLVHATRDAFASLQAPELGRYRRALSDEARNTVRKALRDKVSAKLLDEFIVDLGPTAAVLKQVVARRHAELVILGGKHHSALGRWFGGSTSLSVARTTQVPVLVTAGTPAEIRRVLVAVDLSGAARPTLAAAERYAALFGAELRALSVLEPLPVVPEMTPAYDATEFYAMTEELLKRDIWSLIRTKGVEKVTRHGLAVETILREAAGWGADLLVVGSHGRSWVERVLVGSVTERLLNHLPTSLVVVPVSAAAEAVEPAAGHVAANVALSETDGSTLSTPMQFGPTMRSPELRTSRRRRPCAARPSTEASAKPDEMTTTPRTPAAAQSATTSSTPAAGTVMTARSTLAPTALTLG
jgi:nucleotide-binding universal stress UspA family protein